MKRSELTVMMVTHICEYIKNYLMVPFDRMEFPQEIANRTTI